MKFYLDEVKGLGSFVEIEAIDQDGSLGFDKINEQCHFYVKELGIKDEDLVQVSYSDVLMGKI